MTTCPQCETSWTAPVDRCPECCCGPGEGCSAPDCTGTPAAGVGALGPVDDNVTESRSSGRRDGHPQLEHTCPIHLTAPAHCADCHPNGGANV